MEFTRKKFPRLKDCLPLTSGVFHHMSYTFRNEINKAQLDYLLMADAAQRNPAPVIDLIYDEAEDETGERKLTSEELTKLAALMLAVYKPRWDKLGDIYDVEYDPIHNYLDEWEDEAGGWKHEQLEHDTTRTDTYNDLTVEKSSSHEYDANNPLTVTETRKMDETVTKESDADNPATETVTDKRNFSVERSYDEYKETDRRDWDETVTRLYDPNNPMSVEKQGKETVKNSHENVDSVKGFNSASWVETDKSTGGQANNEQETSFTNRKDVTTGTYSDTTTDGEDGSLKTKSFEGKYKDTTKDDPTNGSVKKTVSTGKSIITTQDDPTNGSTNETKTTGTESTSGSDVTTGSVARAMEGTETTQSSDNREREGRHFGNIGNLTSQKMLNEEIELWKWNYVRSILDDAINFLTLDVYL